MRHPKQLRLCLIELHMGVNIQRHADVRMTHDVLEGLRVHAGLHHVRAESMSAYMRRYLGHGDAIDLVVLLHVLSQRKITLSALGCRIILIQKPTVHIFLFSVLINVTVAAPPICTLAFTFTQNLVSIVSSFFAHGISPLNKKSQTCDIIISQIWLFV